MQNEYQLTVQEKSLKDKEKVMQRQDLALKALETELCTLQELQEDNHEKAVE